MRREKRVKLIKGADLNDLERIINDRLADGGELISIDLASLTCAMYTTEIIGDIQKTALDELEDAIGRHSCGECPFFEKPTDGRKKWTICEQGHRVTKDSRCCATYYQMRKEEARDISKDQREDAGVRCEGRGCSGVAEGITASGVRPIQWTEQIPSVGM